MNSVEKRIASLIIKQHRGELTVEESIELEQWANESAANRELLQQLTNDELLRQELIAFYEAADSKEAIWKKIDAATSEPTQVVPMYSPRHNKYKYLAAAVAVGAVLTTAVYFWSQNKTSTNQYSTCSKSGSERCNARWQQGYIEIERWKGYCTR